MSQSTASSKSIYQNTRPQLTSIDQKLPERLRSDEPAGGEASSDMYSDSRRAVVDRDPQAQPNNTDIDQTSHQSLLPYERLLIHDIIPSNNLQSTYEDIIKDRETASISVDGNLPVVPLRAVQAVQPPPKFKVSPNINSTKNPSYLDIITDSPSCETKNSFRQVRMNSYDGVLCEKPSQNSEPIKKTKLSCDNMNMKERRSPTSETGYHYDVINEYDYIHESPMKTTTDGAQTGPVSPSSRPLPVLPLDTHDCLSANKSNIDCGNINVSRKVCIALVATTCLLVIAVVAAVVIANIVKSRGQEENIVEESAKNDKHEGRLNARSFLVNPILSGVASVNGAISGITTLDHHLFVVRYPSTQVNVYDTNNWILTRNITITGSSRLCSIVASKKDNCLYISDTLLNAIYRYNLSDNVIITWPVDGESYGLSLTSTDNVLVTLRVAKRLNEYTSAGSLVRYVSLNSSIEGPWHSVQLSSGQFAVCHGHIGFMHRVSIVDTSGRIVRSYGGSAGSEVGHLDHPRNLAVDRYDNVLVADWYNNRVVLLSPSLAHLGDIAVPGQTLIAPWPLHVVELTRSLYIGEDTSIGRVLVLTV